MFTHKKCFIFLRLTDLSDIIESALRLKTSEGSYRSFVVVEGKVFLSLLGGEWDSLCDHYTTSVKLPIAGALCSRANNKRWARGGQRVL